MTSTPAPTSDEQRPPVRAAERIKAAAEEPTQPGG